MGEPSAEQGTAPQGACPRAPLLSIIIPTYNIDRYIGPLLDAITRQEFRNLEIIAVDGGSTDDTTVLLEKRRPEEPRLSVVPRGRIGPGNARNVGLSHATGEYVWFVDGDDMVASECLLAISQRLLADRPDVLLVNHGIVGPGLSDPAARYGPGQDDRLFARAAAGCFTIADRPWLMDLSMASWNKVIRRDFLLSTGASFRPVWPQEDVPVSCAVVLAAHRISVLSKVCYYYRKGRPGSAMHSGSPERHFEIFDAWTPVLTDARIRCESGDDLVTTQVYHRLFQRAIWHCSTVLETGRTGTTRRLIPRHSRRLFFGQMSQLYHRHVPPGYQPPGGFRGVKFRLIASKSYRAYSALEPLNKFRVALTRGLTA
jgi:CDP-glycerol glycerophosphotransferase